MRDANGADTEVDSHCGLELRGTMSTPIRDVREVKFNSGLTRTIGSAPIDPPISATSHRSGQRWPSSPVADPRISSMCGRSLSQDISRRL